MLPTSCFLCNRARQPTSAPRIACQSDNLDIKKSDSVVMVLTSNHLNEIRDNISPRSKIPLDLTMWSVVVKYISILDTKSKSVSLSLFTRAASASTLAECCVAGRETST
uniref:Uncharacterized protein n=1 Tax=Arundo donax TaxID=35708 RepID=A0A0A9D2J1_ARUDO